MRQYPRNRFVPFTYKEECPRCGWDFLHSEMVWEERTKKYVCPACYDPEHLQDTAIRDIAERPLERE